MAARPPDRPLRRQDGDRPRPPLRAGHEAEWARLNTEKAHHRRAATRALTPAQRIQAGRRLSQQAMSLLLASIRAGHAPKRALLR